MKALNAMRSCRTSEAGQIYTACPDCDHTQSHPLSCGNRNCPHCQNHETTRWIERQKNKLLPVPYFMVTFTLPCDFRAMVLHTHSRRLDFHPHVHVVVPAAGGIDHSRRQWKKKKGKYLFNQQALARVFRTRFLDGLNREGLPVPRGIRPKWIVVCTRVGTGITALKYLSRYLYRGMISESSIIASQNGRVTFSYIEGESKEICHRTLKGEDFLRLILRHVLPRGFRRARDYGFLHSNAKKLLFLVQLILHVRIMTTARHPRPAFKCPHCGSLMIVVGVRQATDRSG